MEGTPVAMGHFRQRLALSVFIHQRLKDPTMNQYILQRISLVASAAILASGAAMAQSASQGQGNTSNATGAVHGSAGTSGLPGNAPGSVPQDRSMAPNAPSVDYDNAPPTAAGTSTQAGASKPHKSGHSAKKHKRNHDADKNPSILDDPNRAGGGSGNSQVR